MRVFPRPLCPGDRVAVVAPSSPALEEEIRSGVACLREMGFEPVLGKSCTGSTPSRGYLAAESDAVKVDDLHDAFRDPSVDGIVCLRGGSGAGRLIRHLDAGLIAANPKVFVGYSDITILHAFIAKHCGLVTFHGPMVASENLWREGPTREAFLRAVCGCEPLGLMQNPAGNDMVCIAPGSCRGELTGGNLALLCTTIGTDAEIETRDCVVLLEDVDEQPYSIDRMLSHLLNAGKLADAAGILLGEFTEAEPPERSRERTVDVVIADLLAPLGIPVLGGFCAGHGETNLTLPLGAPVRLDASGRSLYCEAPRS